MKRYLVFSAALAPITYCHAATQNESLVFESTESFKRNQAPSLESTSFDEIFQHANKLFTQEKYKGAALFYKKALTLHPTCAHTFFNLGQAYLYQKKYSKALGAFQQTVKQQPNHVRAYIQIGVLLLEVNQSKDAIVTLKKALQLNPHDVETKQLLARAFSNTQQFSNALELMLEVVDAKPRDVNAIFELANIYNHINVLDEALALYKKLDSMVPNNPSIIYNIGFTLKKLGRTEESLEFYNRAIELNPEHYDALFSRGLAYLVLGDFERGWEGYEWRYRKPLQGSLRNFDKPRWNGIDENITLLLHAEQGLGDTFQFIRYAQMIKKTKKNITIIAAVQKPLVTLISLCPYIDTVIALDQDLPQHDAQAPLMSLPHILKTRVNTVPCDIPYLFADEQLVQQWKEILDQNPNFKVGICVQGNENYATPHLRMTVANKSVQARQLGPICHVPGVSVYSLQKTTGTDQFNDLPEDINIITFDGDFDQSHGRFMDTVAVIRNLNLVITVDTSIAHVAAGLGIPTWIMLPNPADWRWMQERTDTPWYTNVRLFKQPKPGDWDSMIAEVAQELAALVKNEN